MLNKIKYLSIGYGIIDEKSKIKPIFVNRHFSRDNQIVIKILYSGVCHSDWHYILNEWKISNYPLIPGHEIVGTVLKIGANVTKFIVNDIVAVGPIINSCQKCNQCYKYNEQYCENGVTWTYNSKERNIGDITPTGDTTYGGYSDIIIVSEDFAYKVPHTFLSRLECVPPLMCAATTTYYALKQMNIKPHHKVGIVGIGGLGHLAIKIAKAMGAFVVGITSTEWKLKDLSRLGADRGILSKNMKSMEQQLDFIINTIPIQHDINSYIELLKLDGTMWILGTFSPLNVNTNLIMMRNLTIKGSIISGTKDTDDMLNFCSKHNILADVEIISTEKINDTYKRLINSDVKYRFVIDFTNVNTSTVQN